MTGPAPLGASIGEFVSATNWDDLDPSLIHSAKRSLLNFLGCCLGSANQPAVLTALDYCRSRSAAEEAGVYGPGERLDTEGAAFVNAMAGNLLDYDDTHLRTVIHPSAAVAPPVLAHAELNGASGKEVLLAYLLGGEISCRIGNALSPAHYSRGWHVTTTCGVFGGTVAVGRLMGLDAAGIHHGLGIAASQAAGIVQNLPNAAKNVSVGNAARNALTCAWFARAGYQAAPQALEGELGWASASGTPVEPDELLGELGERWEIADNTYKPYPAGIVMHSIIDACLSLQASKPFDAGQVQSVFVEGNELLLARGDREVNNERDAKVSIHHCVAAPVLWGKAGLREFSAECVRDQQAVALRKRVVATRDDSLPTGAARLKVTLFDGTQLEQTVLAAHGSLEKPLSDADIEAKVRDLAVAGQAKCDVDAAIGSLWQLDQPDALDALFAALAG